MIHPSTNKIISNILNIFYQFDVDNGYHLTLCLLMPVIIAGVRVFIAVIRDDTVYIDHKKSDTVTPCDDYVYNDPEMSQSDYGDVHSQMSHMAWPLTTRPNFNKNSSHKAGLNIKGMLSRYGKRFK